MENTGKKIALTGFIFGVIANLVWIIGRVMLNEFGYAFFDPVTMNDLYYKILTLAVLLVTIGHVLKFLGGKGIIDLLITITSAAALVMNIITILKITIHYSSMEMHLIFSAVNYLFMVMMAVNMVKKGNKFFAFMIVIAFFLMTYLTPYFRWQLVPESFDYELYLSILVTMGFSELCFFGICMTVEMREV